MDVKSLNTSIQAADLFSSGSSEIRISNRIDNDISLRDTKSQIEKREKWLRESEERLEDLREHNEDHINDIKIKNEKIQFQMLKSTIDELNKYAAEREKELRKITLDDILADENKRSVYISKLTEERTIKERAEIEKTEASRLKQQAEQSKARLQTELELKQISEEKYNSEMEKVQKLADMAEDASERAKGDEELAAKQDRRTKLAGSSSPKEFAKNFNEMLGDEVSQNKSSWFSKLLGGDDENSPIGKIVNVAGAIGKKIGGVVSVLDGIASGINAIADTLDKGVKDAVNLQTQYYSQFNTRLQGLEETDKDYYSTMTDRLTTSLGSNPYINQKELISNISKFVSEGVAFNYEERAVLETLKDTIATTFNSENIARFIRLQQTDTTLAAMGNESELTRFLNSVFKDSSFMNGLSGSISGALIEATSQLTAQAGTEFEFAVKKWLGAMYSVGMSESAVNSIAQGLNYLGTGNVESLTGNSGLMTLFGLAAKESGQSISSLLTQGVNAETVDKLMSGLVKVVQGMVTNSSNQVTKAAWGNITNLSVADMRAISNLTNTDINAIQNEVLNYQGAADRTNTMLNSASTRISMAEKYNNFFDNTLLNFGNQLVDSGDDYLTWRIAQMVGDFGKKQGGLLGVFTNIASGIAEVFSGGDAFVQMIKGVIPILSGGFKDDYSIQQFLNGEKGYMTAFNQRGDGVALNSGALSLANFTATPGVSYSADLSVVDSSSSNSPSLVGSGGRGTSTVSDASASSSKDASSIYSELFEKQNTPIRVSLAKVESSALNKLADGLTSDEVKVLKDILSKLKDTVKVDLVDSDVTSILNTIRTVRSL